MPKRTSNVTEFQASPSLQARIRALVLRGLLLVAVAASVVAGGAAIASAHTTVAPSHVITPLDPTPPVQCSGAAGPC